MGRVPEVKVGLSLATHRELGIETQAMREAVQDLRGRIKAGLGSATPAYMEATRLLQGLKRLETALLHEAVGEHVDTVPMAELKAF